MILGLVFENIFMTLIFAVQLASLVIIFERLTQLYFKRSANQLSLLEKQLDLLSKEALMIIGMASVYSPASKHFQEKTSVLLAKEKRILEKRIVLLPILGNLSALIGFLGVAFGIYKAFSALSAPDLQAKSQILESSIRLAVQVSAYGLIVTLPALVAYSVFQNRINQILSDLTLFSLKIIDTSGRP